MSSSFIVAGAALAGLIAGAYVRVLAGGFRPGQDASRAFPSSPLGEPGTGAEPVKGAGPVVGADPAADAESPADAESAAGPRAAYRAEAREAFRRTVRAVPLPAWPPLIEGATAAACALVAWKLAGTAWLAAWIYAAVAGCALAVIDWRIQRLPDAITLPSYPILAALLVPTGRLVDALLGGLALAGAYALLWFARPEALGLGDVKLAGLTGMLAGALGLDAWLVGAVAGQFLGALYAIVLLAGRRGTLKSQFPLGPFILFGALAALLTWTPS
ncbi:prepilin peptidase [Sphaerisporangium perillae]|uniref:prepilin peptidase n=1 Tax=Sphaerisporangium perillae TaxID=2935860 RepID=UPI00200D0784|nr:A24 family peptidase [Sphaerisporangium perillae]